MKKGAWLAWIIAGLLWWAAMPVPILAADDPSLPAYVEPDPKIIIADDRWLPVFEAGSQAVLNIPIKNVGGRALNTVISLNISDPKTMFFETDKMSLNRYISSFSDQTLYSLPITIPANIEPGTYPLSVNVSFESTSGSGGSESATVYVKITNELRQPQLKLFNVQMEGDQLEAGQSKVVRLIMRNDGDLPINNISLRLSGFSANGINLDNWPDTQYLTELKAGEIHPVEYKLRVGSKLESGTHALDLAVQYEDKHHRKYNQEQKVYLPVIGKGDQDDFVPRIMLDNYYLGGDYVQAGQTFPLTLVFRNTSDQKSVRNIKASLSSEGDIFAPVGSSSSFYFPIIPPNQTVEHTIILNPRPNADHKVYTLVAKLDYQDEEGNKLEEQETISLPVVKEMKLTTSDVEVPPEVYPGSPTSISLDLYNTGRSNIRNLMIKTEGDFEVQNGTLFIGSLEAGKDDYYDATLVIQKEGKLKGKVILSYEDEMGQVFQMEKNFTLTVMPAPPAPPMGPEMPVNEAGPGKIKKWMIFAGAAMLIMAVTAATIVRLRRRRKLKEVELDE